MRRVSLRSGLNHCRSSVATSPPVPVQYLSSSTRRATCEVQTLRQTGVSRTAGPQCRRTIARLSTGGQSPPRSLPAAADQAAPPAGRDSSEAGEPAQHTPVLLDEILGFFADVRLRTFVDGTLGAGGHACAIAAAHQVILLRHAPPVGTVHLWQYL